MDTPNADYDSVWKQAIERYWLDFTELFLNEEWGSRALPESQDQELAKCSRDGKLGMFRVDKLLRAPGADGQPCLWHIEIQAARERGFAERMFVCHYRLYDHFRLPLRSIAILGDCSPTWRPDHFDLLAGATRVSFEFETIKLRDFENRLAELILSDNVFAWLVATHLMTLRTRGEPNKRLIVKASMLTGLNACDWDRKKFTDVYDLIDRMMSLPEALQADLEYQQNLLSGRNHMAWVTLFEQRAEKRGLERGIERGLQEGRQEGRLEALRQLLASQLAMRFGPLDERTRQLVNVGSAPELEKWALAVITAEEIDEVFGGSRS